MGSCAPGLALSHAIARVGCIIEGCCYGAPTTMPWAIHSDRVGADVHPTQIYSMVAELANAALLQYLWRKPGNRKYLFPLYVMILSVHRFITEGFRGTPHGPEIIEGLRFYQSVCVFLFAFSLCVFFLLWKGRKGLVPSAAVAVATALIVLVFHPVPEPRRIQARIAASKYLVVTRSAFVDDLKPWIEHREAQGYGVAVRGWDAAPSSDEVTDWIRKEAGDTCSYVLVVGDCAAADEGSPAWHIPTNRRTSTEGIPYGADAPYADLDGDGNPDVPLGRLPVRTPAELRTQINKIIEYDRRVPTPSWYRSVVWAGAEGYNEQMLRIREGLSTLIPDWLDYYMISGYPESAYAGYPPDQPREFLRELSKPSMLSLIISHGSYRSVTVSEYQDQEIVLTVEDAQALSSDEVLGPLFILACDSGAFDVPTADGPSLGEAFLQQRYGPVDVVSATMKMNPLTNYFVTRALVHHLHKADYRGVGDLFLAVQRDLYDRGRSTLRELAVNDSLANGFMASLGQMAAWTTPRFLQREVLSYNLLGDPACRLYIPQDMALGVKSSEKGDIVPEGAAPEGADRLYAHMINMDDRADVPSEDASPDALRARFVAVNPEPKLLYEGPIEGDTLAAQFMIDLSYYDRADYIRFLALGDEVAYYMIFAAKPFSTKAMGDYRVTVIQQEEQNMKDVQQLREEAQKNAFQPPVEVGPSGEENE